ncbi:methyltransferase domain-containing protein [Candidatus Chlorohelix allophototropha]|uniref:Methyltransferase domain-containing protein n=2 Tax=Candidatus Chlorohelix allophototropha TaxID=3003348 RepID=A0ABY9B8Y1_9CHLR|nr:methyltransferase domain-containing protein [Chloroflexota bacterium L227-S17]
MTITPTDKEITQQLEAEIEPWLAHMKWRPDFAKWREGRIWQEKKQARNLDTLRLFLRLATLKDDLRGKKILDLGCGMGGFSTALALEGARVQPYDYNRAYCRITRLRGMRYKLNFSPVNGAGEALPFPNAHFDHIVCLDVLEHVQNPEKLLSEISRCLKPGGVCFITAINRFAFSDPHYHVRFVNWLPRRFAEPAMKLLRRNKDNSRFGDRQTLDEMHYYRYDQLSSLTARHGFTGMRELGELELASRSYSGLKGLLKKSGLLRPVYLLYRYFYKGTYQLMVIKR